MGSWIDLAQTWDGVYKQWYNRNRLKKSPLFRWNLVSFQNWNVFLQCWYLYFFSPGEKLEFKSSHKEISETIILKLPNQDFSSFSIFFYTPWSKLAQFHNIFWFWKNDIFKWKTGPFKSLFILFKINFRWQFHPLRFLWILHVSVCFWNMFIGNMILRNSFHW